MEFRISLPWLLSLTTALFFLGPDAVQGNAIASWWVDTDEGYAPQIFRYNETTGKIYSSLCNSISTPIFAQNDSTALETTISPASGTSIASLGYLSGSTTEANVFYVADLDGESTIASASYTCNTTTGTWSPSSSSYNTYISNGTNCAKTAPSLDPVGGLSALYISSDDGMRLFFKTAEFQTHYIQYQSSGSCTGWSYVGIASNLTTGHEVSSAFLSSNPKVLSIAQTVFVNESAQADTLGEIEISTSDADGVSDLWSINRMPTQIIAELKEDNSTAGIVTNMSTTSDSAYRFVATDSWGFTFSSFSAAAARLGVSTNSNGIPSVFYIGSDGYLRRFAADTQGHWHEDDSEDDSKWPAADADNADFGTAYDSSGNRIWMFYESGGAMIQVYQSATDVWEQFTTLSNYNASLGTSGSVSGSSGSGSSSGSTGSGSGSGSSSSSMSASTKVGLGIGLGLGIPLACATAALVFFLLRRRRRTTGSDKYQYPLSETTGSPGGATNSLSPLTPGPLGPDQNQGYWQNGIWIEKTATMYYAGDGPGAAGQRRNEQLGELPTVPVYEMPVDGHRSEAHEMPTTT